MNVDYFTKELDILILFDERHECRLLHERIRYFNSIWRKHELRNNSTVFEELEVSIVDLTVANAVLLATRRGARKTDICDREIHNWHRQLCIYSTVILVLMKFSQRVHTCCTFQIPSAKKIVMYM